MKNVLRVAYILGLAAVYFSVHYTLGGSLWVESPFGQLVGYVIGAFFGTVRVFMFYGWIFIVPVVVLAFRDRGFFATFMWLILGYFFFFLPYLVRNHSLSDEAGGVRFLVGLVLSAVICAGIASLGTTGTGTTNPS